MYAFCNNRLVDLGSFIDSAVAHNNRISYDNALFNAHIRADDRIMYLAVNLSTLADNTAVNDSILRHILRTDDITSGIDFPEFFIEIELRNNIDQLHVCFPVGAKRSDIFPVAVELVRKQTFSVVAAVRQNVFSEVTARLILQGSQRFL